MRYVSYLRTAAGEEHVGISTTIEHVELRLLRMQSLVSYWLPLTLDSDARSALRDGKRVELTTGHPSYPNRFVVTGADCDI